MVNLMERPQTLKEELANTITHGAGLVIGVVSILLFANWKESSFETTLSLWIYTMAWVFLYSASTLLHATRNQKWKKRFVILDHSSIYIFIAACYTPVLVKVNTTSSEIILVVVWSLAIVGVIIKWFFLEKTHLLGLILYLLMGWLVVVIGNPVAKMLSREGLVWLFAGGLSYTFGVYFFVKDDKPFFHTIWHLFVLVGSACHFQTIIFYLPS